MSVRLALVEVSIVGIRFNAFHICSQSLRLFRMKRDNF